MPYIMLCSLKSVDVSNGVGKEKEYSLANVAKCDQVSLFPLKTKTTKCKEPLTKRSSGGSTSFKNSKEANSLSTSVEPCEKTIAIAPGMDPRSSSYAHLFTSTLSSSSSSSASCSSSAAPNQPSLVAVPPSAAANFDFDASTASTRDPVEASSFAYQQHHHHHPSSYLRQCSAPADSSSSDIAVGEMKAFNKLPMSHPPGYAPLQNRGVTSPSGERDNSARTAYPPGYKASDFQPEPRHSGASDYDHHHRLSGYRHYDQGADFDEYPHQQPQHSHPHNNQRYNVQHSRYYNNEDVVPGYHNLGSESSIASNLQVSPMSSMLSYELSRDAVPLNGQQRRCCKTLARYPADLSSHHEKFCSGHAHSSSRDDYFDAPSPPQSSLSRFPEQSEEFRSNFVNASLEDRYNEPSSRLNCLENQPRYQPRRSEGSYLAQHLCRGNQLGDEVTTGQLSRGYPRIREDVGLHHHHGHHQPRPEYYADNEVGLGGPGYGGSIGEDLQVGRFQRAQRTSITGIQSSFNQLSYSSVASTAASVHLNEDTDVGGGGGDADLHPMSHRRYRGDEYSPTTAKAFDASAGHSQSTCSDSSSPPPLISQQQQQHGVDLPPEHPHRDYAYNESNTRLMYSSSPPPAHQPHHHHQHQHPDLGAGERGTYHNGVYIHSEQSEMPVRSSRQQAQYLPEPQSNYQYMNDRLLIDIS